jgi:hypothetical protein
MMQVGSPNQIAAAAGDVCLKARFGARCPVERKVVRTAGVVDRKHQ